MKKIFTLLIAQDISSVNISESFSQKWKQFWNLIVRAKEKAQSIETPDSTDAEKSFKNAVYIYHLYLHEKRWQGEALSEMTYHINKV